MKTSVIHDYIAGGLGGMGGIFVGHPLDTTKVQLQTQQSSRVPYRGTLDAINSISQHGLVRGFFRGLSFPLSTAGLVNAVYFGVYGNVLRRLGGPGDDKEPSYWNVYVAGCVGGLAQSLFCCPAELVKVVLQSQIPHNISQKAVVSNLYFNGPHEAAVWLYRRHGLSGFYHGFAVFALRDVPTFGAYVVCYEALFRKLAAHRYTDGHGVAASLLAGGVAGMTAWTLAMPFDVVKSLLQADVGHTQYSGALDCAVRLYSQRGITAFYTGLTVVWCRAFPVNAITFLIYSQSLRFLQGSSHRRSSTAENESSGKMHARDQRREGEASDGETLMHAIILPHVKAESNERV